MDKEQRNELHEKLENIIEKYKNKPRLYQKIRTIAHRWERSQPVELEQYREFAKMTAKIKFDCDFKDGHCRRRSSEMCCCSSCAGAVGHFDIIFFSPRDREEFIEQELVYYLKKYSTKTGFWKKGIGCTLPRERRSPTCLTYNCSGRFTNEEKLVLEIIRQYRHIIKLNGYLPSYMSLLITILKDYFLYRKESL